MTTEDRATQTKVGIFIFIGLVVIGAMIVYFGRFGEAARTSYTLNVHFSSASGLLRGAEVLLAGARVGRVSGGPDILPDLRGVNVELRIYGDVKIPSGSEFAIGSSGLLGDRFIQINLGKNAASAPPLPAGATLDGKPESGGIGDMAQSAEEVLVEIKAAVNNINAVAEKINKGVLSEDGVKNLSQTLENLRVTSSRAAEASAKIDGVVAKAESVVDGGQKTMDSAASALDSAKRAAEELEKTLKDVRGVVRDVKDGKGALGMLVANREVAENLRALVANLRRNGILWYKDREKAGAADGQ